MEDDSMGKIVAIGGVTPPQTLDLIDKEIIKLTKKKNPRILYIPTAGGDDLCYCDFFKSIYEGKFGCRFDTLFLVRDTPSEDETREKVFASDIVYVEGGSIFRLMDYFKKFNMDKVLKEAYKREIVLAGKSAGALCWGRYYFENDNTKDLEIDEFNKGMEIECLKLLDFTICPHYNVEGYSERLEAMVKAHSVVGIALDNNCAIEIIDNNYRVIAANDNANAYKVYQNGAKISKEMILKDCNFRSINKLLQVSEK